MRVVSTNIGRHRVVVWNQEAIKTGIFKYPVDENIYLGQTEVEGDAVIERKYHGGIDKACYIFSEDHYPAWQAKYPHLEWSHGMFGENLTVNGLDEKTIRIGDVFKVGSAKVQVSEPRQPCFKLNIRFNSKTAVKEFVHYKHCGCYLRVIDEGYVENGDVFRLIESNPESLTVYETFSLLYAKKKDVKLVERALKDPFLGTSTKRSFQ